MKNSAPLLFFLIVSAACSSSATHSDGLEDLRTEILLEIESVKGDFGIAFKYLDDDKQTLFVDEHESFHAASTMKVPVMIELYKQAASGKFHLRDSILVHNEFKSIIDGSPFSMELDVDSDEALYGQIGQNSTIYDLMVPMITKSSNLATNILIDLVGAENTTQTMRDLGAKDIQVLRGVEDQKAFDAGKSNTTTAFDLMVIMEAIGSERSVDASSSREMFEVLLDQEFDELIPAKLPDDVIVAHKTGFITGVQHDAAIVKLPNGTTYILVILTKNLEDVEEGKAKITDISRMIYDYVISNPTL